MYIYIFKKQTNALKEINPLKEKKVTRAKKKTHMLEYLLSTRIYLFRYQLKGAPAEQIIVCGEAFPR